jgi:hypothetical protein
MITPYLVRLTTGEDLLAGVSGVLENDRIHPESQYVLKKVMRIYAQPDPTGRVQVAFGDFPPFGIQGDDLTVAGRHIMFITTPNKDLVASYQKATSSLITTAGTGLII